jgi:iron(III) transport system substrate-binding protein
MNSRLRLLVGVLVVLATACSGGAAPAPVVGGGGGGSSSAAGAHPDNASTAQLSPEDQKTWDETVAAAKKEGEVLWSNTQAIDWMDRVAAQFTKKYGIKVNEEVSPPPDFNARYSAELGAGKQSTDIRTGGGPTMRDLDARHVTVSLGKLPVMFEPKSVWIDNPFQDIDAGKGFSVFYGLSGYYLLANNTLCPPDNCPKSFKDLADPRYKGMLLLSDPLPAGGSPGTRWAAYTYLEYGEDYLKNVAQNVAALSRSEANAQQQIAKGEHALYLMTPGAPTTIVGLPKPWPFRLIAPDDGQMVLLLGLSYLQQPPHPNAAKVLANYILSQEGQQVIASGPGDVFIRTDVTPAAPELVRIADKLFPRNPDTFEFASTYAQYIPYIDTPLKARGLK